jgi:hypothetical protein
MKFRQLVAATLFIVSVTAWAQETPAPAPVGAPKRASSAGGGDSKKTTSINFEDELIEGEVKKPELLYLLQKKQFNFKRLIKLRENFIPEMGRTSVEVGRGRGQN